MRIFMQILTAHGFASVYCSYNTTAEKQECRARLRIARANLEAAGALSAFQADKQMMEFQGDSIFDFISSSSCCFRKESDRTFARIRRPILKGSSPAQNFFCLL